MIQHVEHIRDLLQKNHFPVSDDIREIPSAGSDRVYYRIEFAEGETKSLLAAFNPDVNENIAWVSFSIHFKNKGFHVPEIIAKDESYRYFLLEDLGDTSLFGLLQKGSENESRELVKEAIRQLIRFQVEGIEGLDLDVAYPAKAFDRRSIHWDLNYFKYYFIKPNKIDFDENRLENAFESFADLLLQPEQHFFLYRDFQSRNIMVYKGKLWFIDFQGGRCGPLQYDLVSFLYQAKANFRETFREEMVEYYLGELEKILPGKRPEFEKYYNLFAWFRLMQVFGAYGFRGIIQRKGHFLQSIAYAINNLENLLKSDPLPEPVDYLKHVFEQIAGLKSSFPLSVPSEKLTVEISSFSYLKTGYPVDFSANGGGFVFDCRALPNPGRIPDLRNFTGLEKPVKEYLANSPEMADFLHHAFSVVDQSIENYLERGFTHLSVNFGCTGGRHRSVYSTEQLKKHLTDYGDRLIVKTKHIQIDD